MLKMPFLSKSWLFRHFACLSDRKIRVGPFKGVDKTLKAIRHLYGTCVHTSTSTFSTTILFLFCFVFEPHRLTVGKRFKPTFKKHVVILNSTTSQVLQPGTRSCLFMGTSLDVVNHPQRKSLIMFHRYVVASVYGFLVDEKCPTMQPLLVF